MKYQIMKTGQITTREALILSIANAYIEKVKKNFDNLDEDNDYEDGEVETVYGMASYKIGANILSASFSGDYDTAPHGWEGDCFIEQIIADVMNSKGCNLPNIEQTVNLKIRELI
jgi:hypothetical protein